MDGLELIRRLRAEPGLEGVKIIVSSASVFASDQHRSLEAGGDDFLAKPVDLRDLLDKLARHLGIRWIRRQPLPSAPPVSEGAAGAAAPEELLTLPAEELDALLDLARRGRVNPLLERVRALEQGGAHNTPFVRSVGRLARSFQLKELAGFIERSRAAR
jgi:CheY-like chemotaxis protein